MESNKDEIVGHQLQRRLLSAFERSGRVPKGILFTGPDSVGKRLVAKEWISKFYEERMTHLVLTGAHPDVFFIEKDESEITVEDIRVLQEFVSRRPVAGRKFVLIDQAHRMNEVAGNAFLKTLEEPGKSTCFVLISSQPARILPTIRSRCLEVRFGSLHREELDRISRDKKMLYEGTVSPIVNLSVDQLRELYRKFLTQAKGRPIVLKERDRLIHGFRIIGVYLHDLLTNRIAPDLSYGVSGDRVDSFRDWVEAVERLFDLVSIADLGNLASIEAELVCRIRMSL